nr:MAG: viral protein 4 [Freshwater turtle neural virus 1]
MEIYQYCFQMDPSFVPMRLDRRGRGRGTPRDREGPRAGGPANPQDRLYGGAGQVKHQRHADIENQLLVLTESTREILTVLRNIQAAGIRLRTHREREAERGDDYL